VTLEVELMDFEAAEAGVTVFWDELRAGTDLPSCNTSPEVA
jgi:hypothetical protein